MSYIDFPATMVTLVDENGVPVAPGHTGAAFAPANLRPAANTDRLLVIGEHLAVVQSDGTFENIAAINAVNTFDIRPTGGLTFPVGIGAGDFAIAQVTDPDDADQLVNRVFINATGAAIAVPAANSVTGLTAVGSGTVEGGDVPTWLPQNDPGYLDQSEADARYYTQAHINSNYYTRTDANSAFLNQSDGDARYIRTIPDDVIRDADFGTNAQNEIVSVNLNGVVRNLASGDNTPPFDPSTLHLRDLLPDDGGIELTLVPNYLNGAAITNGRQVMGDSFRWSFDFDDTRRDALLAVYDLAGMPVGDLVGQQIWFTDATRTIRGRISRAEDIGTLNNMQVYIGHSEDRAALDGVSEADLNTLFGNASTNTEDATHLVTLTGDDAGVVLLSEVRRDSVRVGTSSYGPVTVGSTGLFTFTGAMATQNAQAFVEGLGGSNTSTAVQEIDDDLTVEYGSGQTYVVMDADQMQRDGATVQFLRGGATFTTPDGTDVTALVTALVNRINFPNSTVARANGSVNVTAPTGNMGSTVTAWDGTIAYTQGSMVSVTGTDGIQHNYLAQRAVPAPTQIVFDEGDVVYNTNSGWDLGSGTNNALPGVLYQFTIENAGTDYVFTIEGDDIGQGFTLGRDDVRYGFEGSTPTSAPTANITSGVTSVSVMVLRGVDNRMTADNNATPSIDTFNWAELSQTEDEVSGIARAAAQELLDTFHENELAELHLDYRHFTVPVRYPFRTQAADTLDRFNAAGTLAPDYHDFNYDANTRYISFSLNRTGLAAISTGTRIYFPRFQTTVPRTGYGDVPYASVTSIQGGNTPIVTARFSQTNNAVFRDTYMRSTIGTHEVDITDNGSSMTITLVSGPNEAIALGDTLRTSTATTGTGRTLTTSTAGGHLFLSTSRGIIRLGNGVNITVPTTTFPSSDIIVSASGLGITPRAIHDGLTVAFQAAGVIDEGNQDFYANWVDLGTGANTVNAVILDAGTDDTLEFQTQNRTGTAQITFPIPRITNMSTGTDNQSLVLDVTTGGVQTAQWTNNLFNGYQQTNAPTPMLNIPQYSGTTGMITWVAAPSGGGVEVFDAFPTTGNTHGRIIYLRRDEADRTFVGYGAAQAQAFPFSAVDWEIVTGGGLHYQPLRLRNLANDAVVAAQTQLSNASVLTFHPLGGSGGDNTRLRLVHNGAFTDLGNYGATANVLYTSDDGTGPQFGGFTFANDGGTGGGPADALTLRGGSWTDGGVTVAAGSEPAVGTALYVSISGLQTFTAEGFYQFSTLTGTNGFWTRVM